MLTAPSVPPPQGELRSSPPCARLVRVDGQLRSLTRTSELKIERPQTSRRRSPSSDRLVPEARHPSSTEWPESVEVTLNLADDIVAQMEHAGRRGSHYFWRRLAWPRSCSVRAPAARLLVELAGTAPVVCQGLRRGL